MLARLEMVWSPVPVVALGIGVAALLLQLIAFFVPGVHMLMGVVPAHLYGFNLLTGLLLHPTLVESVADVAAFVLLAQTVEARYGRPAFVRFLVITGLVVAIGSMVIMVVVFSVTGRARYVFMQQVVFPGWTLGMAVAVKHLSSQLELDLKLFAIRAKYLPLLYASCAVLAAAVFEKTIQVTPGLAVGLLTSWTYIRFWRPVESDCDESDFDFATFLPPPLDAPVAVVAAVAWKATAFARSGDVPASRRSAGNKELSAMQQARPVTAAPLPGSDQAEAERRRARAKEALERRLATMAAVPDVPLDDGDDVDGAAADPTQAV